MWKDRENMLDFRIRIMAIAVVILGFISLTGLDFEDLETQFLLQCSFRIDAYLEATRH